MIIFFKCPVLMKVVIVNSIKVASALETAVLYPTTSNNTFFNLVCYFINF